MHCAGPLAKQNIKDRYYGVNDPVADKMLNRVNAMPKVVPPEDPTITTLYVGGIAPEVQESDLRDYFYPYGEITSIKVAPTLEQAPWCCSRRDWQGVLGPADCS